MTVLALTEECDLTADRVITELARRSVPVFRCDLGWFPTELSVDFGLDGDRWSGALRTSRRDVDLAEVRSVWYRRPTAFRFPEGMSGPERQHAGWEAKLEAGGPKVAYTRALSATDLSDLSGTELTTLLVQERVDKAFEVRLTAVGDRLFGAAIDADSDAARADWRADMSALSYRAIDVPEPVAAGVRAYMATFGLHYGAFDFVVTPGAAEFVFMECNPGGQYGWIEGNTGLPITAALADLLARGQP
ncbi:MAG: hypothetical protein GEU83_09690 [Pseudonocardiaceae bacterium]|nr:hypothetical protein [Pseudonocardiaceae bacterium]